MFRIIINIISIWIGCTKYTHLSIPRSIFLDRITAENQVYWRTIWLGLSIERIGTNHYFILIRKSIVVIIWVQMIFDTILIIILKDICHIDNKLITEESPMVIIHSYQDTDTGWTGLVIDIAFSDKRSI